MRAKDLYVWRGSQREWDVNILQQPLALEEVKEARRITLSDYTGHDTIIRTRQEDRMYMVKSGY